MCYYQILVETNEKVGKAKNNKKIYELDKTDKTEVLEDILIPYLKKETITVNGYFLDHSQIIRIIVKTSEISSKEYVNNINRRNKNSSIIILSFPQPSSIINSDSVKNITRAIFKEAEEIIEKRSEVMNSPKIKKKKVDNKKIENNKVFIVHGHDEDLLKEVKSFLLALRLDPIILRDQVSEGKTIIEKLEKYTDVIPGGITLFTACDHGSKKGETLKPRARQNVVIEHGFLMGKIGREKVIPLVEDGVELPGDIKGAVYVSTGQWKTNVGKELIALGYDINPMHLLQEL